MWKTQGSGRSQAADSPACCGIPPETDACSAQPKSVPSRRRGPRSDQKAPVAGRFCRRRPVFALLAAAECLTVLGASKLARLRACRRRIDLSPGDRSCRHAPPGVRGTLENPRRGLVSPAASPETQHHRLQGQARMALRRPPRNRLSPSSTENVVYAGLTFHGSTRFPQLCTNMCITSAFLQLIAGHCPGIRGP
jgi:hypothetical protein